MAPQQTTEPAPALPHRLSATTTFTAAQAAQKAPKRGTDEYAALHKSAGWWRGAGFPTIWDAMASKCWHDNAHEFRGGQRVGVAE